VLVIHSFCYTQTNFDVLIIFFRQFLLYTD